MDLMDLPNSEHANCGSYLISPHIVCLIKLGLECLIKGADLQVIVVENDRGEEEALMELGPPVAVTGLMVKFVVLMRVMMMTSGTTSVYC